MRRARQSPEPTEPLDPAIIALVDALARDLAREDHERAHALPPPAKRTG